MRHGLGEGVDFVLLRQQLRPRLAIGRPIGDVAGDDTAEVATLVGERLDIRGESRKIVHIRLAVEAPPRAVMIPKNRLLAPEFAIPFRNRLGLRVLRRPFVKRQVDAGGKFFIRVGTDFDAINRERVASGDKSRHGQHLTI